VNKLTEIKIFSGRSHRGLAEEICQKLHIKLSLTKVQEYANGCFEIILQDELKGRKVFLIQTSVPQTLHRDFWELLQMVNAAKKNGAKEIIVVMPYVSYARSDKIYAPGMAISAELLIRILKESGIARFIGIDFHSKEFEKFLLELNIKGYHLSALPLIAECLKTKRIGDGIMLPGDEGALDKTVLLAKKLGLPVGVAKKKRIDDKTVIIEDIVGEVSEKDIIVLDDEISVGTTIGTLGKKLEELSAKSLTVAVTHGLFVGKAIENLKSLKILREIVVTDSLPISSEVEKSLSVRVLSVAGLIAEKIKEISNEF